MICVLASKDIETTVSEEKNVKLYRSFQTVVSVEVSVICIDMNSIVA